MRGDPSAIAEAGRRLSAFDARSYAPQVDVPTAVIVSSRDRLVAAARQRELADAIPGAKRLEVDVAHDGWLVQPEVVWGAIESAIGLVVERPGLYDGEFGRLA